MFAFGRGSNYLILRTRNNIPLVGRRDRLISSVLMDSENNDNKSYYTETHDRRGRMKFLAAASTYRCELRIYADILINYDVQVPFLTDT